jgi:hypothetical protein
VCFIDLKIDRRGTGNQKHRNFSEGCHTAVSTESVDFAVHSVELCAVIDGQCVAICSDWKDWGGSPVNPREKQDANEFLLMLFDRIDEILPDKPVTEAVLGKMVHQVVGMNDDFKSDREEPFPTFGLEVQNNSNFAEALPPVWCLTHSLMRTNMTWVKATEKSMRISSIRS